MVHSKAWPHSWHPQELDRFHLWSAHALSVYSWLLSQLKLSLSASSWKQWTTADILVHPELVHRLVLHSILRLNSLPEELRTASSFETFESSTSSVMLWKKCLDIVARFQWDRKATVHSKVCLNTLRPPSRTGESQMLLWLSPSL